MDDQRILADQLHYFHRHPEYKQEILTEVRSDPVVVSGPKRRDRIRQVSASQEWKQRIRACQATMDQRALRMRVLELVRDVLCVNTPESAVLISGDLLKTLQQADADLIPKYGLFLETHPDLSYFWEMEFTDQASSKWTVRPESCDPLFPKRGLFFRERKMSMVGISNRYILESMHEDQDLIRSQELKNQKGSVGLFQRRSVGVLGSKVKWDAMAQR